LRVAGPESRGIRRSRSHRAQESDGVVWHKKEEEEEEKEEKEKQEEGDVNK
jgi:hypothetical protein